MGSSFYLSVCAILISIISLAWTIHVGLRDRGKLKTCSQLYRKPDSTDFAYMKVKAVNQGRRPIILTMIGSDFPGDSWSATYFEGGPIRLGENESFEKTVEAGDNRTWSDEGEKAIDLWFEDTLGRRYRVKSAKKNLRKLWGENKA